MLEELIALIGESAVLELIARWGGREIYVPHCRPPKKLEAAIGQEATAKLIQEYPGLHIWIPKGGYHRSTADRPTVRAMREDGCTIQQIADRFGVCKRRVYQLLKSTQ